ncbi:MAG: HDOD domain-containing protein [Gammaproteobacteria bacterium]|nr:HDOD domain-containing protein [Gammaproteobacteria bacterium]
MTTVWERVTGNAKLISLPAVYLRLREVLDQPEFTLAEVAEVISKDPALSTRILRLVNSPFFGFASKIDSVFRAINLLGTHQVHDLALATSVTYSFAGMSNKVMDMSLFWHRSVACGLAARKLAKICNVLDSERLFVSGLLKDIGHLIMYQSIPDLAQQAMLQAEEGRQPLHLVERELIGIDYARVGGVLMRQWRLPESLRESTEFHVEPGRSQNYPLVTALVHIAALMTETLDTPEEFGAARLQPQTGTLELTGLNMEQCQQVKVEVESEVSGVLHTILPSAQRANG